METKFCPKCEKDKELKLFSKKRKSHAFYCKECMKGFNRVHYLNNKDLYKKRARARSAELRQRLIELKDNKSCADCKLPWPYYCLDFDHISGVKKFNISQAYKVMSEAKVQEELQKCELVCANCHRIRTHNRRDVKSVVDC